MSVIVIRSRIEPVWHARREANREGVQDDPRQVGPDYGQKEERGTMAAAIQPTNEEIVKLLDEVLAELRNLKDGQREVATELAQLARSITG